MDQTKAVRNSFHHLQLEMISKRKRLNSLVSNLNIQGKYLEIVLLNALKDTLPNTISASPGVIWTADIHSNDLDIIVYDNQQSFVLFRAGDFVIVPPRPVWSVIEVKSLLTLDTDNEEGQLSRGIKQLAGAWNIYDLWSRTGKQPFKLDLILFAFGLESNPELTIDYVNEQ